MVETLDFGTFERAFGRVCGAFRVRVTTAEREELTRTYFKVLDAYALDDVITAGRRVLEKHKKFPAIADWLAELGAAAGNETPLPFDARQMTADEVAALTHAEQHYYRDDPCGCLDCLTAGVTDRELRFVPTLVEDWSREERAFHPRRRRLEVTGHWAHGEELARWYDARQAFYTAARRAGVRHVAALLLRAREPGEEG